MKKYKIHKFNNGLTLIICNYSNYNSLYFDLAIKVGSRFENKNNNGITHLTEHLIAKKAMDSMKKHTWIKSYINENFSAYTLDHRTNFEFSLHKNDLNKGIKFLSEILKQDNFKEKDIKFEKKIILEELLELKDNSNFIYQQQKKKKYYRKNPLSFETLGTEKSLKKVLQKDIKNFINTYYQPENIILTVAGCVNDKELVQLIKSLKFTERSTKQINGFQKYKYIGDRFCFIDNKSYQNHFGYYLPIFNKNAEENIKWEFFVEILNHYLFYMITKELSCYSINTNITTYTDFSNFFIESSFEPKKTLLFYNTLQKVLKKFKKSLSIKEFNYLKNRKLINLDLDKDYPREFANVVAWHAFMFGTKRTISLFEQQKIIKSITLKNIYDCFDYIFKEHKGIVIISGQISKIKKEQLRQIWNKQKI